ncbi:MAG: hypothetical protein ACK4FL_03475 [Microgenomates group bacterium]
MKDKKNIKNQKSKIKNIEQKFTILKILFFIIIFSILFINLIYSQKIPPLYLRLINNDRQAAIEFLQKIKNLPQFPQEFEKYKKIYGERVEDEVFAKERERKQMIKNLEQMLEKNPKARDVLYSLFLLYEEDGDKTKAMEYLIKAREVDPEIK